jgi:pimeloyl-ACP methyl ester carboxylesterase
MTQTTTINGTSLHVEVRGHGPPVLLIPGATGDAGHSAKVSELLASDHTVITYDRRGNSRSPASGPTSLDQQADDAAALLRQLGVAPATVFGTSGGAIIALRLALRSPDVVKRLIVHEPPFIGALPDAPVLAAGLQAQLRDALAGGPRHAMEVFLRANAGDEAFDQLDPALRTRMLDNGAWFFSQELAMFTSWIPSKDELAQLHVPVRVLAGEDHEDDPQYRAAGWLAHALGSDLLEVPGTHAPYFAQARDLVAALRPLLDDEPRQMRVSVRGRGRPLVLVGGGLTGMASWKLHQARLAANRKVVRAQLLGVQYGLDARALPAGYSVAMEADALGRALDDLGFAEPIDLVAWSYGGEIALDYALRHPARIRSLTLIEPPAMWVLEATGHLDAEARRGSDELRAFYATVRGPDVTPEQLATFARSVGLVPPGAAPQDLAAWPSWRAHRRSLLTGDAPWRATGTRAQLTAFAAPVLLVRGTGSAHFLHQIIDGLASALPNARTVELPGGHAPQLVARDRFLAELAQLTGN